MPVAKGEESALAQETDGRETAGLRRCKMCGELSAAPLYRLGACTVHGCPLCDFHATDLLDPPQTDLPPDDSPLDPRLLERIDERLQSTDPFPELRLRLLRRHLEPQGKRCLDIGAGVGLFLRLLLEEGALALGLEPSAVRREYASRRFGLDLHREPIESFGRRKDSAGLFDAATLWDVIEHVNSPAETLEAARRVLKPGGLLFIDTPSREALPYRLGELSYRLSGGKNSLFLESYYSGVRFGHKQIFRPRQLVRMAEEAGLEILELRNSYPAAPGLASLLRPRTRIVLTCRRAAGT